MGRPQKAHPVAVWHSLALSGKSYDKIAAAYNVTRGTVAGALHRLRGPGGAAGIKRGRPTRGTATHFGCGHERTPENSHKNGKCYRCAICNKAHMAELRKARKIYHK